MNAPTHRLSTVLRNAANLLALGSVIGGLLGIIEGGFSAMITGERWQVVTVGGWGALCGMAALGLLATVGLVISSNDEE
ncbi:MAG: hypothetical protein NT069_03170 [Planctomycetota bacterium]|nr:hypothetical protein [Planctomycetota bacterium]